MGDILPASLLPTTIHQHGDARCQLETADKDVLLSLFPKRPGSRFTVRWLHISME